MASCGVMPASFYEMLASCVMKDEAGSTFLNVMCYNKDCADYEPALACGEPTNDPEAYAVANLFGVDSCGYPALKMRVCVVADAETES